MYIHLIKIARKTADLPAEDQQKWMHEFVLDAKLTHSLLLTCCRILFEEWKKKRTIKNGQLTSGSANLGGSPTTNTRFFCTTRTLARCFRFSEIFAFRCWSRCRFSALNAAICSCERGVKSAGFSGYAFRHAGHSSFSSVRILCQQNRQICGEEKKAIKLWVINIDDVRIMMIITVGIIALRAAE